MAFAVVCCGRGELVTCDAVQSEVQAGGDKEVSLTGVASSAIGAVWVAVRAGGDEAVASAQGVGVAVGWPGVGVRGVEDGGGWCCGAAGLGCDGECCSGKFTLLGDDSPGSTCHT